jgi:dihydrofolate reductase
MSKLIFDIAISLDGFMAGENRSPQNPIGDRGMTLHEWMFNQKAFWEHLGMEGGKADDFEGRLIRDTISRVGAYIMGKRMFEEGEPNWPEDLFKADVFVLTHEKREPWVQNGTTVYYFTDDKIENVLEKAKISAGGKDVRIQGGGNIIQQYLNAGLVDEFCIHISPVILGSGIRLFDHVRPDKFYATINEVLHSEWATHLKYSLIKI